MHSSLSDFFASRSQFKVLELLCSRTTPIPLRHVAELTELHVHSVENALKDLLGKKAVLKRRDRQYVVYSLNKTAPEASLISEIFALIRKHKQQEVVPKATDLLDFIDSTHALLDRARK